MCGRQNTNLIALKGILFFFFERDISPDHMENATSGRGGITK